MKTPNWKAHIALLTVNVLYGANHVLAKGLMPEYLDPTSFIFLRVSGAVLLFWILFACYERKPIEKADYWRFAACGLFGVALNQLFFFHGLHLSSAFNSGIIMAINPILVVLLSLLLLREKLSVLKLTGIALGAAGAILMTLRSGQLNSTSWLGDLFLLINAASYALYLVLSKPLLLRYSPLQVITYVFTIGLIFLLLFPPTWSQLQAVNFAAIPQSAWFKIAYVIIGVTFLTYLLTIYGLKSVSPTVSSVYIYTQPIMVVLFTYLFVTLGWSADYRSAITPEKFLYMGLIFTGVFFVSKKSVHAN
ncbi:MAG: hypothetical protein RLZZ301_386 [Bacteroidota bacterium]